MTSRRWESFDRSESSIVDQLLKNRGIVDAERFLQPDYERDSYDPFLLPNMETATKRIIEAIKKKERIAIFADYDADGIPGGVLLKKYFQLNDLEAVMYIPDREKEGYGLNNQAIEKLHTEERVTLIITVDLGITNRDQVTYASSLGIDVIITDHHHIDNDRIPTDAVAIIHPALEGSTYPFKGLAGGGVAWKLAQALASITKMPSDQQLKWFLELAAISTVCDIVPLVDENRMIVSFGIKVLQKTKNLGLKAMYQAGNIQQNVINERTIGFQIGPRINAPGRVDSASTAAELLLTGGEDRAGMLSVEIEQQNKERQLSLERMCNEAIAIIDTMGDKLPSAIVLRRKGWLPGLIGLAASRIVERYHRPVILLGDDSTGALKGSGRSIDQFNLLEAIAEQRDLLSAYGGHEKAAGLQLLSENFDVFAKRFIESAEARLREEDLTPRLRADAVITLNDITTELVDGIHKFAPFGNANPRPSFIIEPLTILYVKKMGQKMDHVKYTFANTAIKAIGFRFGDHVDRWKPGDVVSIFGSLGWNEWNGQKSIEIQMRDVREYSKVS